MERYFETADIAREEGIVTATVRADVLAGRLKVAARTLRGTRLFRPRDVVAYRQERRERLNRRARRGTDPEAA